MIVIPGYTSDDKVPGVVAINEFGAGKRSSGAAPTYCTLFGLIGASGAAAEGERKLITTPEDADAAFEVRSELARMCEAALDVPGAVIWAVGVAEAGGAAAATLTLTIGGSWTASGEIVLQLDEEVIRIAIAGSMTATTAGDEAETQINQAQGGRLFCTASNSLGTVTITVFSKGVRGNQHTGFLDTSDMPSGMTAAITGGTALANGGVPFSGGTGSDDIQNALDATDSISNKWIGIAHNDATNVGKVETESNGKAAFDVGLLENYTTCVNGDQTAAIAIGQTTMNDSLGCCVWDQWGVEHPSRTAARAAALFSTTESSQPNTNFDEVVLPGAAPHFRSADSPNRTLLKTALNNSLTPLVTVNGDKQIVRAIMSRSLNGSTPDYRNYDRADTIVSIRVREELVLIGAQAKEENKFAGPDVGEGLPPEGTFTPRLWNSIAETNLRQWATPAFNWLTDIDNNLPTSEWDSTAKRVMSVVPTVAKPQNHQLGAIVRQTAA